MQILVCKGLCFIILFISELTHSNRYHIISLQGAAFNVYITLGSPSSCVLVLIHFFIYEKKNAIQIFRNEK